MGRSGQKCLWGFANCASLRLLDITRNAPHFWTLYPALIYVTDFIVFYCNAALVSAAVVSCSLLCESHKSRAIVGQQVQICVECSSQISNEFIEVN